MIEASRALVLALVLLVGAAACSEEEPVAASDLQGELERLREQIEEAERTAEQHSGGLIGDIAGTRLEVLRLSAAMLENRLIAEQGGVPTEMVAKVSKPNSARAEQILRHIAAAEDELEEIEDAASQRDGMAGSLSQAAIATQELTIAQLRQAYFEAAYGLAPPSHGSAAVPVAANAPPLTTSAPPASTTRAPPAREDAGPAAAEAEPQVAATPPPEPEEPLVLDTGDYARIQRLLRDSGFNPGPIDGQWGPRTKRALVAFQRSAGLPPTGEPDRQSMDALGFD